MGKYKFCQSCGMPMNKDPEGGGTDKDGNKSEKYCFYCYRDGAFTADHIKDAKEMQEFCIRIMKGKGMNGILAWLLTRGIPRLERWQGK